MIIDLNNIDKNARKHLFGDTIDGLSSEQTTPEWNIAYYQRLIKYTNKTILKNKHKKCLAWWIDAKEKQDRVKNRLAEHRKNKRMTIDKRDEKQFAEDILSKKWKD